MLALLFGLVHSKPTHTGAAMWDSSNTRMDIRRRRRANYERVAAQIGLCNTTKLGVATLKPP